MKIVVSNSVQLWEIDILHYCFNLGRCCHPTGYLLQKYNFNDPNFIWNKMQIPGAAHMSSTRWWGSTLRRKTGIMLTNSCREIFPHSRSFIKNWWKFFKVSSLSSLIDHLLFSHCQTPEDQGFSFTNLLEYELKILLKSFLVWKGLELLIRKDWGKSFLIYSRHFWNSSSVSHSFCSEKNFWKVSFSLLTKKLSPFWFFTHSGFISVWVLMASEYVPKFKARFNDKFLRLKCKSFRIVYTFCRLFVQSFKNFSNTFLFTFSCLFIFVVFSRLSCFLPRLPSDFFQSM